MASRRDTLLKFALELPEAWEDTPWEDDLVVKAAKKIFVFLGGPDATAISVKLPVCRLTETSLDGELEDEASLTAPMSEPVSSNSKASRFPGPCNTLARMRPVEASMV